MKSLTIEASAEKLNTVLTAVREELKSAGCPDKAQRQIGIAVEEIFINISSYAYAPKKGVAVIDTKITGEPLEVIITFTDWGIPYDPVANESPDTTLGIDERQIGGLGIFMTSTIMDEVTYHYQDGKNILTLKKKI